MNPLVPLLLLTLSFDYWFIDSQIRVRLILGANRDFAYFGRFDHIMIWSSIYDVITLFLVNVLLVWQLSLIYRAVSSNRQSRLGSVNLTR